MHQLALVLMNTHPSVHGFQLLVTSSPPPRQPYPDLPFHDSQLFDLPFSRLLPCSLPPSQIDPCPFVVDTYSALATIGVHGFDVADAVSRLKMQLSSIWELLQPWKFWKFLEEPEYGPGRPVCTLFFMAEFQLDCAAQSEAVQLLTPEDAWGLLVGKHEGKIRLGPLATYAFTPHFPEGMIHKFNLSVQAQEYPPGVLVLPLKSSTFKPFGKTNLVIFASTDTPEENAVAVASGEALIMDPGCHSHEAQGQLATVVRSLPKKLLVFLTHHHLDHIEGLPIVEKQNQQATIIAHESTIHRIRKGAGRLKCLPVRDGSLLLVGKQELRVVAAPGHTDGHMALLHESTQTLVVGDHCVGHREAREAKILETIERGANTAFEIVSQVYSDTTVTMWMAALSNVKLHIDHLNQLQKLPPGFSMASFRDSCGSMFRLSCLRASVLHSFSKTGNINLGQSLIGKLSLTIIMGSIFYLYIRKKHSS